MPRIMEVTVYKFDELSPKAKTRALDKAREALAEDFDAQMLTETFKEQLEEVGLPSKDIQWQLSYVQGDGVAFYGRIDLEDYLKANKLVKKYSILKELIDEGYIGVTLEGRGVFYGRSFLDFDIRADLTPAQKKALDDLTEEISEQIKELTREFQKNGYAEIEYQSSEEVAKEHIKDNDYEFDERGDRI